MNLLALETSSDLLSVAVQAGERLHSMTRTDDTVHSGQVFGVIVRLLAEAEIEVAHLDGVAFGAGPGAFTGVRLGCGLAQGLALARSIPVVPLNSLLVLAEEAWHRASARRVVTAIDARLGEVYYAIWERGERGWESIAATSVERPDSVPTPEDGDWVGAGSGFLTHGPALRARLGWRLAEVLPELRPVARSLARLALPRLVAGEGVSAADAAPIYARDKVALTSAERAGRRA